MTYTYADLHRWNTEILSVSNSTGVPANVLKAIMWVESRGMLNARSPLTSSGYYFGLMQVGATSSLPEYMKSVIWLCDNAYNQVLAGGTEMVNKSYAIGSQNWIQVAGAYFGYGTDVLGTTTNAYMQQFHNHATALIGTTPGGNDWTPPPMPTPTVAPVITFAIGSTIAVDADTLNMRSGPSLSSSITKVLLEGASGIVLAGPTRANNFDWYQIKLSDNSTGWVAGQYMKAGPGNGTGATTTPTPTRTPVVTGNAGGGFSIGDNFQVTEYVNFRRTPGYSGGILRSLDAGTAGTIIGTGRTVDGLHWSNVRLSDNSSGWIASDYIKRVTVSTATPTRTATRPVATSTPTATASPTAIANPAGLVYRTTTRVNLRKDPTTSSQIISTLPTGALATSLGNTSVADGHTWLRIQSGSFTGWMSMRYLSATGASVATSTSTPSVTPAQQATRTATPASTSLAGRVYRTTTRVNIRQAPSTSGSILATLPSGTTLISLGDSTSANGHVWLRVQAGSIIGWMAMGYISPTGATAATPTGITMLTNTPTSTPAKTNTPTRPASGFISGDVVRVESGPLNYRNAAGTSSGILGTLATGSTAMVLNGPTSASGLDWYQLQVTGQPNGWVAANYLGLVSASVVHGSTGDVENVNSTLELTPTPTSTPTSSVDEQPVSTVGPPETPTLESTLASTGIPESTDTVIPEETTVPSETTIPTETFTPAETFVPTETPLPPTATPSPTSTPTLAPDSDGDGIADALDICPGVADSGLDTDGDGIDDACDPTPAGEPTQVPLVERGFDTYTAADTSLATIDWVVASPDDKIDTEPLTIDPGSLPIGGETGGIAYLTFYPDQIGSGQVENAVLYLTGIAGSGPVDIAIANGVVIDEYGLTMDMAPGGSWAASAWIDAGVVVPVDLTGWITADGPVTIIISGEGVSLGSREGGAPAWLSITVLDSQ